MGQIVDGKWSFYYQPEEIICGPLAESALLSEVSHCDAAYDPLVIQDWQ